MPDLKIAVTLAEAADLTPFSEDYLRKAVRRTSGNPLPARFAARKYVVTIDHLREWVEREGVEA